MNNVAGVNGGANVTTSSGSSIINSAVAKAVASLNQVGTSLDDGEISLNSHARTQLMAKLSRDSGLFPAAQAVNPKPHAMMPV